MFMPSAFDRLISAGHKAMVRQVRVAVTVGAVTRYGVPGAREAKRKQENAGFLPLADLVVVLTAAEVESLGLDVDSIATVDGRPMRVMMIAHDGGRLADVHFDHAT